MADRGLRQKDFAGNTRSPVTLALYRSSNHEIRIRPFRPAVVEFWKGRSRQSLAIVNTKGALTHGPAGTYESRWDLLQLGPLFDVIQFDHIPVAKAQSLATIVSFGGLPVMLNSVLQYQNAISAAL